MCYIGERLHYFESINKEVFIRNITSSLTSFTELPKSVSKPCASKISSNTILSHFSSTHHIGKAETFLELPPTNAINTFSGPTKCRDQPPEKTSEAIIPVLGQRKDDFGQLTSYIEVDTASVPKNDCSMVQRHANAKSPHVVDPQSENRRWTFGDHIEIDPAVSTTTAAPFPGLQSDTFCSWCGCLQNLYKPSQGLVSCDGCFTPCQSSDLAAARWDLEDCRSTEPSFDPPSGLSDLQGDLENHALTPEVTSMGTYGNDPNDFSWFMSS